MAKVVLDNLVNLQNEQSAVTRINTNNDRLEVAIENTLSRDGTSPNEMNADLDMNDHRIYNLPEPVTNTEPLRKIDADEILSLAEDFEEVLEATEGVLDAYESLQQLYLGEKTSFPTVDNQGNPLQNGTLVSITDQPNSDDDGMYVYHDGSWNPVGVLPTALERVESVLVTVDGQTVVTIPGGYTVGTTKVFRNGVFQIIGSNLGIGDEFDDVTANNGSTLVFPSDVLTIGEKITVVVSKAYAIASLEAADVTVTPSGTISSTNVQAALAELDTEKVAGPGSSTDNAVARFDATSGKLVQNSVVLVADTTGAVSKSGGGGIPLQGTNTNDNASAGYVGEYVESEVADPGITLTTGVAASITSISLTAGDWDVRGLVAYKVGAGTTPSSLHCGVNTAAALPSVPNGGAYQTDGGSFTASALQIRHTGTRRYSFSTTTTVYLIVYSTFAAGAGMSAYGGIYARRAR